LSDAITRFTGASVVVQALPTFLISCDVRIEKFKRLHH
jgi:hypothetical protein